MRNWPLLAAALLLGASNGAPQANSCTEVLLNKTSGIVVSGRTLDYDCELGSRICFHDKGTTVSDPGQSFTTLTGKPLSWTSKYGAVMVDAFELPAYVDAMNTEGLSVATLWHNETEPAVQTIPGTTPLSNVAVVEYIVENAKNIEEAKKLFSGLSIYLSKYKGGNMTLHWIVTEKSGKSLVVELKKGRPNFFEEVSKVGVLANSPSYDLQLANLKACEEARKTNPKHPLPGDYQSPSRFIKSAYLVERVPEFKTADEAKIAATQILHNVESPKGAQPSGSYTQWMVVRDQTNLRYWLMSVKQPAAKLVDLNTIDFKQLAGKTISVDSPLNGDVAQMTLVRSTQPASNN